MVSLPRWRGGHASLSCGTSTETQGTVQGEGAARSGRTCAVVVRGRMDVREYWATSSLWSAAGELGTRDGNRDVVVVRTGAGDARGRLRRLGFKQCSGALGLFGRILSRK